MQYAPTFIDSISNFRLAAKASSVSPSIRASSAKYKAKKSIKVVVFFFFYVIRSHET